MVVIHPFRSTNISDERNIFPLVDSEEFTGMAQGVPFFYTMRWMKCRFIPYSNVQGGATNGVRCKSATMIYAPFS